MLSPQQLLLAFTFYPETKLEIPKVPLKIRGKKTKHVLGSDEIA